MRARLLSLETQGAKADRIETQRLALDNRFLGNVPRTVPVKSALSRAAPPHKLAEPPLFIAAAQET